MSPSSPHPTDPSTISQGLIPDWLDLGRQPLGYDLTWNNNHIPSDPALPHDSYSAYRLCHNGYPAPPSSYVSLENAPRTNADTALAHLEPLQVPTACPSTPIPKQASLITHNTESYPNHPNQYFGMVYPPPPPPHDYSPTTPADQGKGVSLPSMGSWAPPPTLPSTRISLPSPGWGSGPPPTNLPGWRTEQAAYVPEPQSAGRAAKRSRDSMNGQRRSSDADEVEAGLALAGLGLGFFAGEMKKRRKSVVVKREDERPPKDGRKSCSECRRLKAKCDRVFPCSNCRRRGCALVCPDGDLSCMQGKRLVLASTEQLHDRISQLEAARFHSHGGKNGGFAHPLLAPQYLDGGFAAFSPPQDYLTRSASPPLPRPSGSQDEMPSPKEQSSTSSFTVATPDPAVHRPASQGRMAVESLLLSHDASATEGKREDEWVGENAAPAMLVGTVGDSAHGEQHDFRNVVERLGKLLHVLPSRDETRRRSDAFFHSCGWYNTLLRRDEFDAIYEPAVYAPTPSNSLSSHKLACVLILLTLQAYFDLSTEQDQPVIADYWEGVQKCFDTRFGWAASVAGVQALGLATVFVGFDWRGARASSFYWLRQMTSAAQQLGLHKDPHPSLPKDEREFRRRVFWESYVIDCLVSITHGQRTALPIENIETNVPTKDITPLQSMKYAYMRMVKSRIIDVGCRPDTAPASWDQILAIDEHLMSADIENMPEVHCPLVQGGPTPPTAHNPANFNSFQLVQCTTSMCHFKAMMFLYRPSLRRLITRLRAQPFGSVLFDPSDLKTISMTYKACHAITATSLFMARTHPRLSARCWSVWVQTFSAAVSMAALAIWCGPHLESTFIESAFHELCEACSMINDNGSQRSMGVLTLLPILKSLVTGRYPQIEDRDPATANISVEGEDMLFALLGGQVDQKGVSPTQGQLMQPTLHQPPIPQLKPDLVQGGFTEPFDTGEWPINPSMALPVVDPAPLSHNPDVAEDLARVENMSPTELWARLQTFYEPTPVYWGQSAGFVDYSSALGAMGLS